MNDTPTPSNSNSFTRWCLKNPVEVIGSVLTIALTLIVFFQVLFRYTLHSPLDWSEELAMFLFQWCVYIGAAIAVRRGFHYHLDLVTKRFPDRLKALMTLMTSVCIFVTSYIMIYYGVKMMIMVHVQSYPVMKFSMAYGYLPIPISGALILIYQFQIFTRQLNAFRRR
jgi:TRAP-type C4-dicarboxylate transport system permease small subunit